MHGQHSHGDQTSTITVPPRTISSKPAKERRCLPLQWCMVIRTEAYEETQPVKRVSYLLEEAEQAIRDGNRRTAYELSLQATEAAPRYAPAWVLRAGVAPSQEEKIG